MCFTVQLSQNSAAAVDDIVNSVDVVVAVVSGIDLPDKRGGGLESYWLCRLKSYVQCQSSEARATMQKCCMSGCLSIVTSTQTDYVESNVACLGA